MHAGRPELIEPALIDRRHVSAVAARIEADKAKPALDRRQCAAPRSSASPILLRGMPWPRRFSGASWPCTAGAVIKALFDVFDHVLKRTHSGMRSAQIACLPKAVRATGVDEVPKVFR